ncbi:MAG: hypothetical protein HY040_24125 [Planctomycetes bacterium]|nr:hypothetical protein [Planctomycetota bacterium]
MALDPRYLNISSVMRGFSIFRKTAWTRSIAHAGMVVASEDACYFVVSVAHRVVLSRRRSHLPCEVHFVKEVDLADLPLTITEHPEWPVWWRHGPVVVVPREVVRSVRTSFWMGGIDIEAGGVIFRTFTPFFRRKQMAGYLREAGWRIEGA